MKVNTKTDILSVIAELMYQRDTCVFIYRERTN